MTHRIPLKLSTGHWRDTMFSAWRGYFRFETNARKRARRADTAKRDPTFVDGRAVPAMPIIVEAEEERHPGVAWAARPKLCRRQDAATHPW